MCGTCSVYGDENSYISVGVKTFLLHWDSKAFAVVSYRATQVRICLPKFWATFYMDCFILEDMTGGSRNVGDQLLIYAA